MPKKKPIVKPRYEPIAQGIADADYAPDGLGVVFRVSTPKHRLFGRISVFMTEFQGALKTHSKAVAKEIADAVGGNVVPYAVADRMERKKTRRMMGWELPWILHDLPQRQRN